MPQPGYNQKLLREREDLALQKGVYVSMEELAAIQNTHAQLDLRSRRKSLATVAGTHRSTFRGRGIDFDEVRIYNPGDDVRNIDWRVTARSGKPHTKLFREERERPVYLVVDQSQSMFFGSRVAFKSVVAARAAAYLAWACRQQGDRVGGCLFNDTTVHEIRPKEGKRGIQQFLRLLVQFNQDLNSKAANSHSRNTIIAALEHLNHVVRPGSLVFLLSDFRAFDDITQQHLSLIVRHSDMIALSIFDPMEQQLPPPGYYGFTDGKRNIRVYTGDRQLRKHYRMRFIEHQARLKEQLASIAVPLLELSTDADILSVLTQQLGVRTRKKAH